MSAGSSFNLLLARLAAEHEKEVQVLKAESSRLAEALVAVDQSGGNGEQALQGLREEKSNLLSEVLALRVHGYAKQECALETQKLRAALRAAEQEREQLRVELAASRIVQLTPWEGPPNLPLPLPGCVEVQLQESEPAAKLQFAQAEVVDPTLSLPSGAWIESASQRSPMSPEILPDNEKEVSFQNRISQRSVSASVASSSASARSLSSRLWAKVYEKRVTQSEDEDEGLESKIEKIAVEEKIKQLERLVELFHMDVHHGSQDEVFVLPFDKLQRVLRHKGLFIATDRLQEVLTEMARVTDPAGNSGKLRRSSEGKEIEAVDIEVLADIIVDWNIMSRIGASFSADVYQIRDVLMTQDVDEVIGKVTRLRRESATRQGGQDPSQGIDRLMLRMNIVVSFAVMLSILSLGLSMDYWQNSAWWVVLEALFGVVFVGEVIIKCWIYGVRTFFCGSQKVGNWFDFVITLVAVLDVLVSTVTQVLQYGDADQQVSATRLSLVLRCVRLARIARLVKLFKAPCMKELANMLSGFFIGMPSLMWVMVLLGFVIYVMALALKSTVGPEPDQDFRTQCGDGDNPNTSNPECEACKLYAEEFLPSVPASMMVVFRCVVGDCTSKGGQSLSAHLSSCYSWKFDIIYFLGMVAVIFGLFNIITAIFVQATMDGLQFNHVQNKYAQLYESHYMHRKLQELVDRVETIYWDEMNADAKTRGIERRMTGVNWRKDSTKRKKDIMLSEGLFYKVIQDATVNALFEDLDVKLDHRINTFQLFDLSNDGRVSLVELIQVLMKMRGEPHKSDLVASWAMLEEFRNQFHEFQKTALNNQMNLFSNQKELMRALQARPTIRNNGAGSIAIATATRSTDVLRSSALSEQAH